MDDLLITTWAESEDIAQAADELEEAVWSQMGFLNHSEPFVNYYDLMRYYPDYQIAIIDQKRDYVVATGNLLPMRHDDFPGLPDGGWDWAIDQAHKTRELAPNMVVGLSISVPSAYRNRGLARVVLGAMRNIVASKGLGTPYLPVRPTMRERHLDTDIAEYATWRREDGKLYDPWLRSHEAAGGRMIGICRESMVIEKSVGFWEAWSGQAYEKSGDYPIAGGLAPVAIDLERGIGRYVEPNIWYH
jgi:hypothetical protein